MESSHNSKFPLYLRVLLGVALGIAFGMAFGKGPIFGISSFRNEHLGQMGGLVIRFLKALAVPLIFFSIVEAFLHASIRLRDGARLIAICLFNGMVAMTIGLVILNVFKPGLAWRGQMDSLLALVPKQSTEKILAEGHHANITIVSFFSGIIPKSLSEPFLENNVLAVVLLSLLVGFALKSEKLKSDKAKLAGEPHTQAFDFATGVIEVGYKVLVRILFWVVQTVPFAVFGVVAQVVGASGLGVFRIVWVFFATIVAGLSSHALLYYPTVVWLVGKKSPRQFVTKGSDAVLTGLSTNSSLATVPVTLRCLGDMGVSKESSRLAACVGTNFNNDGITLYEAMSALFLAQAVGFELGLGAQFRVLLQSLLAGAGVAGIPEAGLIVLPLVLGSVGLPEEVVAGALPLIMTVDWVIARLRSGVNVMSDMVVAILLDRTRSAESAQSEPSPSDAPVPGA